VRIIGPAKLTQGIRVGGYQRNSLGGLEYPDLISFSAPTPKLFSFKDLSIKIEKS
jgi:hypothetical protein